MKKINFDFIPPHLKCTNCGECCGPVPISEKEYERIFDYCIENNIKPLLKLDYSCEFRDEKQKKCLIYPVRPDICKLFGVSKGMNCPNGNSYEIDGVKFIQKDIDKDLHGIYKLTKELLKKESKDEARDNNE